MKIELKDEQLKLLQDVAKSVTDRMASLEAAVRELIVALGKK